ncbi:MAG: PAS domain S-box protein [Oryzomonas sp.]|uniref:PAS domain S-box protein n=1 Tax=Oryzomonas sp. TaxID=2855186 RepID=UPI0028409808|nr:PAS domain S-box protein [Oryzomonas sp.]MDR3579587.1 PAS domain S-box protein [Oryzomonas sp.]
MSKDRNELILNIATEGFWDWDLKSDRAYLSPRYCELAGYFPDDTIFDIQFFKSIIHPEDRDQVFKTIEEHLQGRRDLSLIEYRMISKDRTTRWIENKGKTVEYDEHGAPARMVGTIVDITERKTAEKLHRQFLAIIESSTDAIISKNLDGIVTSWNPAAEKMFGYTEMEMLGQSLANLIPPERIDEEQQILSRIRHGDYIEHFETIRRKKNGEFFRASVTISPIRDSLGAIIGASKIARDISDRKREETYRGMGQDILTVLNEVENQKTAIHKVIDIIKAVTGVDAAGIRLQDDDDFPYFHQDGFPQDFLLKENSLLSRAKDGGICQDKCGNICLECTCGLVVTCKTDPCNSLFTKGGSAWTNDSFPLLHVPTDEDIRTNPRNECIHQGFASVALVPIRGKGRVVGLLQLNDRRKGCFTLEAIEILEKIAENIGEAMLRKQAEDKLKNSKELILNILQNTDQGIYGIDMDGNCTFVNRSALTMLGYELDDCIGKNMHNLIHHSYADGRPYPIGDCPVFHGRNPSRDGCRGDNEVLWRRDGTPFPAEYSSYPIINDGNFTGAVITFSNITERKRTFEQLEDITKRLQLAASSAHLGIWDWNVREDHKVWDDRMYEMYGVTRDTYPDIVDSWIKGIHPGDRETVIVARQAALDGERDYDVVFRICRPDGTVRHIKAYAVVLRDQNGTAERMIGVNADVTDIVLAEEEKSKLKTQLNQAQKMESVGRLAGGVAHDFNNMLTVILGHAHLGLMHLEPTHPVCADLKEISISAERSADLTRQLLTFARKQTVAPRVLNLNESIKEVLKMLQRLIGEDVKLIWQPAPELWHIRMDPSQIDQILANLCVNARDAIEGNGQITIETANSIIDEKCREANMEATPGEYVCLSVRDSGCGMDQKTLVHIFEPFFTTKELGKGTGLGLATVYGSVKQSNGFINVRSEPGQGTTFTIYLPRDAGIGSIPVRPEDGEATVQLGRETILLVEDEPAILKITAIMLEKQGYRVLRANTPGEAIHMAREHTGVIHLLMTDVVMPEMNGRDLAKSLLSLYPHMKRLFMSGYTADVIAHHGVLEEGVHFIQKPFILAGMAAKVREALDAN